MTLIQRLILMTYRMQGTVIFLLTKQKGQVYDMFVNIKSFGAVGDGKADDTEALKKALVSEKPVYFPTGIYLVREQLKADRVSVYWQGAGCSSVIRLLPDKNAGRVLSFRKKDDKEIEVYDMRLLLLSDCGEIEMRDLTLDANREAFEKDVFGIGSSKNDYTNCLDIRRAESIVMQGVTCRGGLIEGAFILAAKKIRIDHCFFLDNGFYRHDASGLQIDGQQADSADVHITCCEFSRNGFNGLELTGVNGADIRDVLCRENGFDGIAFWNGSSRCLVSGALLEHNKRAGVTFRRNYSSGALDVMQDSPKFCTENVLEEIVTIGNRYGIHWGCSMQNTVRKWRGADAFSFGLCYLYPDRDITAFFSDVHLSPTEGDIWNPVFVPEDGEFYIKYGAVPCSDLQRFKVIRVIKQFR